MKLTARNRILSRIYGHGRGWVFVPQDFSKDFCRHNISNVLEDLTNDGVIRRLSRGIYDYPRYSKVLKKTVGPDIYGVAEAIARKFNWKLHPNGETVLNYLGLSTQIPGRYEFYSSGPTKTYTVFSQEIRFKHISMKEAFLKEKTMLVVYAMRAIGKDNINRNILETIRSKFNKKEWLDIRKESVNTPIWIQNNIQKMVNKCEE